MHWTKGRAPMTRWTMPCSRTQVFQPGRSKACERRGGNTGARITGRAGQEGLASHFKELELHNKGKRGGAVLITLPV